MDIFPIKESRILTNFNGRYSDVSVLAHEIGHAYHGTKMYNHTMLNTEYPTPIAETASIFCETILNNELLKKLPGGEALSILESSISNDLYFIVDFYGRYLFENELFERRKSGALSVNELNELMINCMKKAYGDSIEAETIHSYMWMNKVGYFMAGNEYLNFPYSFGVLFSKGLYTQYIKNGQVFVNQYDKFLSETSTNNIFDAAKIIGIDVHSMDFFKLFIQRCYFATTVGARKKFLRSYGILGVNLCNPLYLKSYIKTVSFISFRFSVAKRKKIILNLSPVTCPLSLILVTSQYF